jgi:hypothetical protein
MICSWPYAVLIYINHSRDNPDTKLSSAHSLMTSLIALVYRDLQFTNFTSGPVLYNMGSPLHKPNQQPILSHQPLQRRLPELKIIQPFSSWYLRVTFDRKLLWDEHIHDIANTATSHPSSGSSYTRHASVIAANPGHVGPLLGSGSVNRHERNNFNEEGYIIMGSGVSYAVRATML